MKRRLFTILSALSLLLCLAAAPLWVRSFWVADTLHYSSSDSRSIVWAASTRGRFGSGGLILKNPARWISGGWGLGSSPAPQVFFTENDPGWKFLGFDVVVNLRPPSRQIVLTIPYWFLVGIFAILPVIWVRRWRLLRRASRQGLCPTCGYDLRASKERCPECGTAIAPTADPQSK